MATYDFNTILDKYNQDYEAAKTANLERYNQALAIYDEIINKYQPGGSFGQSYLSQLETQKTTDVGKGISDMISSGLYGTEGLAGLGTQWESQVGAPSRLKLEDLMMERLSNAQMGKADVIQNREDVYPDLNQLAQLFSQASQTSNQPYTKNIVYGNTYGANDFPDMFTLGEGRYTGGIGTNQVAVNQNQNTSNVAKASSDPAAVANSVSPQQTAAPKTSTSSTSTSLKNPWEYNSWDEWKSAYDSYYGTGTYDSRNNTPGRNYKKEWQDLKNMMG